MKHSAGSLANRLTWMIASTIGTLWLAVSFGGAWYAQAEVNEGLDNLLVDSAHRLVHIAQHDFGGWEPDGTPRPTPAVPEVQLGDKELEHDYAMYQVLDGRGRMLLRSADAPTGPLGLPLENGFAEIPGWRVYTYRDPASSLVIHAGDSLAHRREAVIETMATLVVPALLALPLTILLTRRLVRRGLAPIAHLAGEVEKRSGVDLRPLPQDPMVVELRPIAESVNRLLARLEEALDTERALAASAAHELRTPLAAMRWRLHALRETGLTGEAQVEVRHAESSLETLIGRTEKLLQFSRAESGAAMSRKPVDLCHLAATVAEEFWRDPAMLDRLHLHTPESEDVRALGDYDALAIVIRNLVENAVRHGGSGPIDLSVESPATIRVRDRGPGIAPQEIARIRERFVTSARSAGSYGLGLAIVGMIVERQCGRLVLESPPPGAESGFQATVLLNPSD
ncbi:MAG: hypothetical protein RIS35_3696 [Pseudomonadota bacterium]